ncbi:phage repressor like XRE family transcriptional regulator [Liquorilactobacillus aquaticus DSM 21051]|uniref:Phage repressor like XRE family transcriptional regulator n=1 Tax=Liquorilactobacillus aquaticus DSM 21051 TaxID=1423725 RepID=A0A0R2CVV3_9LACO|nr:XRE family transcriptional regulator [Liquorilactobacillus aquaticus]KRM95985.1 phage repressor like XRE family transcriptional regulator [Liquorilactobacillus aquaticus DSM 21051]
MEQMGERLKRLRTSLGLTQEELGNRIGLKRAAINKYEKGNVENMKRSTIEKLSSIFNVTPAYLMALDENEPDILSIYNKLHHSRQAYVYDVAKAQLNEQSNIVELPKKKMHGGRSTAAGAPIDGDYQDSQHEMVVIRNEVPRGADEVVTIAGDSMEPLLKKGSQAFLHYQPVPDTDGQVVIVRIKDVGVTCKKIYREDGKIRLKSINDKYEDMVYPAQDVDVIGKIMLEEKKKS